MPIPAYDCRIILDQWDLSGQSNQLNMKFDAQAIEYQTFQQVAKQRAPTDPAATLDHNGYWEGAADSNLEKEIYDRLGLESTTLLAAILGTSQPIPVGYIISPTYAGQLTVQAQTAQLLTVIGQWVVGSGNVGRGYQIHAGTISATGPGATVDFGAAGAAGGKAWLFTRGWVGTVTNATIQVQSDDNAGFTTPTTRGTFTFSSATPVGQEIALPAVERYLRINTTSLGGATSFYATVLAGAAGVTY